MPPRQRGELFVRGRADEDRWRDEKKGRLTLQAAQVWEERDGRTDAAHRTTSSAKRVIEIQVPSIGAPRRRGSLPKESRFRASMLGKIGDLACAQHMARSLIATRQAPAHTRMLMEPKHASSVCYPANIAERGMPNRMISCAACGRSLEATAAWKGSGERYYCNDFCAEAEAVESPSLIPRLTEDVSARIGPMTSRAPLTFGRATRAPAGRPTGDAVTDSRLSATTFLSLRRRGGRSPWSP
jgi:hypothetical protein